MLSLLLIIVEIVENVPRCVVTVFELETDNIFHARVSTRAAASLSLLTARDSDITHCRTEWQF